MTDQTTAPATQDTAAPAPAQAAQTASQTGADAAGAAKAVDASAAAPAPKWWEGDTFTADQRTALTAKGLTLDDPLSVIPKLVDMQINAEKRLGAGPDQLLQKPKKGEDVAAWMKANAGIFGIPEAPDKYEVKRPEGWPKDAKWDDALETEARKIAHEEGLSGRALQRFINSYAGAVGKLQADAATELQAAQGAMMADLEKDWGAQTQARVAMAQQAASVLAEKAGLDQEGLLSLSQALKPKIGDAGIIRIFAAVGEMMANDTAVGLGKGAASLGQTPAQARAELAALRAPGGEYYEATIKSDRRALAGLKERMERLSKLAAG